MVINIILLIIIIALVILLTRKHTIEQKDIENLNNELRHLLQDIAKNKLDLDKVNNDIVIGLRSLNEIYEDIDAAEAQYKKLVDEELNNIHSTIQNTKELQERLLIDYLQAKRQNIETEINNIEELYANKRKELEDDYKQYENTICTQIADYTNKLNDSLQLYESVLAPIQLYEKDLQARLFYTIQIPEEYREDINYLLTVVNSQIRHPDVISKLVWSEYIKPYMDDMIKRVGIKDDSGIYKITSIINNKSYIGKSTNVKKRLQDHIKSSVGITSIADQFVHHEILKTGIWNWTFEIIDYCEKDKLNELEKYYINFFKTQEFGYNRKEGG